MTAIYVLPTEEGVPPRAILGEAVGQNMLVEATAVWSNDAGAWMVEGVPVDQELGDLITAHAKSLGVEW